MATKMQRSVLTASQQGHVRAKMMTTASVIAEQLGRYVKEGQLTIAGREITMSSERLAAWRMVLDRTIPTLSATEVTHRTGIESMGSDQLVARLADLVRTRPELGERLQAALGGRLIEAVDQEAPDRNTGNESAAPIDESRPALREKS